MVYSIQVSIQVKGDPFRLFTIIHSIVIQIVNYFTMVIACSNLFDVEQYRHVGKTSFRVILDMFNQDIKVYIIDISY